MESLRQHIETHILPLYDAFDAAHQRPHALQVIERSLRYARALGADERMAYAVAAYHDVGLGQGRENHHLTSAQFLLADTALRKWFTDEQMQLMAQAIEDHRASNANPPRTIYGRIVAEADRLIETDTVLRRTVQFGFAHYPSLAKEEHYQRMVAHLHEKYAEGGYLKLWLDNSENATELSKLRQIIENEPLLRQKFEQFYNSERPVGTVAIIGSGRMATQIARALSEARVGIAGIASRTLSHAQRLAKTIGCPATDNVAQLPATDFAIFAVSDTALPQVVGQYCQAHAPRLETTTLVHMAGCISLEIFEGQCPHYGSLYPLQTFSLNHNVDFATTPLFVEGTGPDTERIEALAMKVSRRVARIDSPGRRRLHLAAVFASNFVNHLYDLAADIARQANADFDILRPIIDETAKKVQTMTPHQAQTGPAARADENTMALHRQLMAQSPELLEIYNLLSQSIAKRRSKE